MKQDLTTRLFFSGFLAEFVGKRAVEKAAPWKSPRTGLSPSAWKSRKSGGIFTFPTAPTTTGSLSNFIPTRGIAELQRARLVCSCQKQDSSTEETSYSTAG